MARPPARGSAADPIPLRGPALIWALFLLSLANFMALLDMTIVNVSVPHIAGGLAVSPQQGTWVITSYAVAEAITVPLTGWLAQRFGTVKVFVTAIASFGVFSFLCGLAPSLGVLVVFRVCQGLSGGPMMPMSQTLLMRISPPEWRGQAMGIWVMTTVLAPLAGPLLGGTITDHFGWPWIFFINIPIAIFLAPMAARGLAAQETAVVKRPIDYVGLGILITWVGALQIMLDKGKELDWFGSPFIVGLAAVAVVGFLAFLIWELTEDDPIVNLRVFRYRNFTVGVGTMCLSYACFFSAGVLIPLWLQTNMGYTATWAGYVSAMQGAMLVFVAPVVSRLIGKVDSRVLVTVGITWVAGVMWMRTSFNTQADFMHILLPQFLQGFGMPFFFIPLNNIALGALRPDEYAAGSGLLNFARTTASAFAVSITTTYWDNAATADRAAMVNSMNATHPEMHQLTVPGLSMGETAGMLSNLVQQQAVMLATNHIFQVITVALLVSAAVIWIAPPPPWKGERGARRVAAIGH
jgi:DHA2 family multidrug resistance protein